MDFFAEIILICEGASEKVNLEYLLKNNWKDKIQEMINKFILDKKNQFTKNVYFFDNNIESFLEIESPPKNRRDKKPLNIIWNYFKGNLSSTKINELKQIVESLI